MLPTAVFYVNIARVSFLVGVASAVRQHAAHGDVLEHHLSRRLLAGPTDCNPFGQAVFLAPPSGSVVGSNGRACVLIASPGALPGYISPGIGQGQPGEIVKDSAGPLNLNIARGKTCKLDFSPRNRDGYIQLENLYGTSGSSQFSLASAYSSDPYGVSSLTATAATAAAIGSTTSASFRYYQDGNTLRGYTQYPYCTVDITFTIVAGIPNPSTPLFPPAYYPAKQLISVQAVFCIGSQERDGLDGVACPQRQSVGTPFTLAVRIGDINATVFNANGPWPDRSRQSLTQGAGLTIAEGATPVQPILSVSPTGYDQLNADLALTLKYSDNTYTVLCYTAVSVGIPNKQCPQDCLQCTPTYSTYRLEPVVIASQWGSCSCS